MARSELLAVCQNCTQDSKTFALRSFSRCTGPGERVDPPSCDLTAVTAPPRHRAPPPRGGGLGELSAAAEPWGGGLCRLCGSPAL